LSPLSQAENSRGKKLSDENLVTGKVVGGRKSEKKTSGRDRKG